MRVFCFLFVSTVLLQCFDALDPCQPMDVAIVVDWTQSITRGQLEKIIDFSETIVERLYVSQDDTRVVLATFGEKGYDIAGLKFKQWKTGRQIQLMRLLETKIETNGRDHTTRLDEGMLEIKQKFEAAEKDKGRRAKQNVKNVAIIFTDGVTHGNTGDLAKPSDVDTIFVMGVKGKLGRNDDNLNKIGDGIFYKEADWNNALDNLTCAWDSMPDVPKPERFGCFVDNPKRPAMLSLEGTDDWLLNDSYVDRSDPFKRCGWSAWNQGYQMFALQNGGLCFSGFNAGVFYQYGYSSRCLPNGNGGMNANDVYYFKDFAPKVSYGKIGCFKKSELLNLTSMDGDTILNNKKVATVVEKCAWAARMRGNRVFAVNKDQSCSSSPGIENTISNYNEVDGCQLNGFGGDDSSQVYYVVAGGAPCFAVGKKRTFDIGIIVDVTEEKIPLLKTLVNTIRFEEKMNHQRVGLISNYNSQVLVKFDGTESKDEAQLLSKIDSHKNQMKGASLNFTASLIKARDELFNETNGDRPEFKNRLLLFTDATSGSQTTNQKVVEDLKNLGVEIVTFDVGDGVDQNVQIQLKEIATDGQSVVMAYNDPKIYESLDQISGFTCRKGV